MNSIFSGRCFIQAAFVSSLLASTVTQAADTDCHFFQPDSSQANGYYQDLHVNSREPIFTPYNEAVEASLKKLSKDPSHLDLMVEKYYPALSKSNTIYNTDENLSRIKDLVTELKGQLPTLEQANAWGCMKDRIGKPVGFKLFANAAIAFQNSECIKNAITADINKGVVTTVDRLRTIIKNIKVHAAQGTTTSMHCMEQQVPAVAAQSSDIVSIAVQAEKDGFKNIYALVAADKANVNGSPFDGAKNTVDESLAYCAPQLVFVNIFAALGHAYPNPGLIAIPDIEIVRKAKPKVDFKNKSETMVFENLDKNISLSFIFAPAFDLREKIKTELDALKSAIIARNESTIKESLAYTEALEEEKQLFYFQKTKEFLAGPLYTAFDEEKLQLRDSWLANKDNRESYDLDLDARINLFFQHAEHAQADCLIFPAWGSGIFLNKIADIYTAMKRRIEKGSSIKKVIFSTFLPEHESAFEQIFNNK